MPERAGPSRPRSPLEYEQRLWGRGRSRVAGVDEVGRGPLAGPVVACAVVLPEGVHVEGATDSKKLSRTRREELAVAIRASGAEISLGAASPTEIDRHNILVATRIAMERALRRLDPLDHVVIDGRPMKGLAWEHDAVVAGDLHIHSIACASIVAKVVRDDLMRRLADRWPGYGWETNAGYGTAAHREALGELGETPHHRRSFLGGQFDLF